MNKLDQAVRMRGSSLCVGLDINHLDYERIYQIVDKTQDYVAAYKFNLAFWMDKFDVLADLVQKYIDQDVYTILDGKFSDIENTMTRYGDMTFKDLGFNACTVTPFMGKQSVQVLTKMGDVFVVCNPSNGAVSQGHAEIIAHEWHGSCGLVVGTHSAYMAAKLRELAPEAWFLAPGIGAQGGDLETYMPAAMRKDQLGVLVNVSRSIITAGDAGAAAKYYRDLGRKAAGL